MAAGWVLHVGLCLALSIHCKSRKQFIILSEWKVLIESEESAGVFIFWDLLLF